MSTKKLAQQKAGPMSPASEETKADSIGLLNLKGTVKTTLETIRRIQRQTAKAFSLLGIASITGMGIAGLLLAPFPVPTTFSQAQGTTDEDALPAPPVPVPTKLYVTEIPELDKEDNFNMSVRFTLPQFTEDCYYWSGVYEYGYWDEEDFQWKNGWRWENGEDSETEHHNYDNYWNDEFYYPGQYDYWICKIVVWGDDKHYDRADDNSVYAEVWFYPGQLGNGQYHTPSAWVHDSDGNSYYIPVSVNGHEFEGASEWVSGDPPWHSY